jgi:hypothetical protein
MSVADIWCDKMIDLTQVKNVQWGTSFGFLLLVELLLADRVIAIDDVASWTMDIAI